MRRSFAILHSLSSRALRNNIALVSTVVFTRADEYASMS